MTAGWASKTLGEMCGFVRGPFGGSLKKSIFVSEGFAVYEQQHAIYDQFDDIRYFIDAAKFSEMSRFELRPNDLIMSCSGTMGKVAIVPPDIQRGIINQALLKLTPTTTLMPHFLKYWMDSPGFQDSLKEQSGGAAIQNVASVSTLKQIKFACPPLSEQQRIVTLLDEAFDGIATAKVNAEKNLQNARAIFESHLQSVFTQRGEGWLEMPLGEIGKVSMCKRIFKEETKATGDIPFFKIGTFGKEADSFISNEIYRQYRDKYPFPNKGDVLISAAGTIGRRVIYDGEHAYFQDSNIVWIANDQKQLLNHYLYHFYGACEWNSTRGATISRLYNDNLKRIVIAFPKLLHEQQRIAAELDALSDETSRLTDIYQRKLTALDELKKSLLAQAFSGAL